MQQHRIRVEDIVIGERHRALSDEACDRLASSMKDIGLRQPISVRIVDEMIVDGDLTAGVPVLVAGRHRLEAARRLGWTHIDCIEVDDDELHAELWEIDENLMRADLTAAQEAEHLSRRKRLWMEINKGGKKKATPGGPQDVGFASDTSAKIGQSKPQINSKIAIAEKMGPDLQLVAGTSLDKLVELKALARMPEQERHDLAARAAAGEPVTAISVGDVTAHQFKALMGAWNRAGEAARNQFLEEIDTPVFDRTRASR